MAGEEEFIRMGGPRFGLSYSKLVMKSVNGVKQGMKKIFDRVLSQVAQDIPTMDPDEVQYRLRETMKLMKKVEELKTGLNFKFRKFVGVSVAKRLRIHGVRCRKRSKHPLDKYLKMTKEDIVLTKLGKLLYYVFWILLNLKTGDVSMRVDDGLDFAIALCVRRFCSVTLNLVLYEGAGLRLIESVRAQRFRVRVVRSEASSSGGGSGSVAIPPTAVAAPPPIALGAATPPIAIAATPPIALAVATAATPIAIVAAPIAISATPIAATRASTTTASNKVEEAAGASTSTSAASDDEEAALGSTTPIAATIIAIASDDEGAPISSTSIARESTTTTSIKDDEEESTTTTAEEATSVSTTLTATGA